MIFHILVRSEMHYMDCRFFSLRQKNNRIQIFCIVFTRNDSSVKCVKLYKPVLLFDRLSINILLKFNNIFMDNRSKSLNCVIMLSLYIIYFFFYICEHVKQYKW